MGYNCLFLDKGVEVFRRKDSSIVFTGHLKNKLYLVNCNKSESASSPLVGFGWLNDNVIKGLTRLLSVNR